MNIEIQLVFTSSAIHLALIDLKAECYFKVEVIYFINKSYSVIYIKLTRTIFLNPFINFSDRVPFSITFSE